MVGIPTALVFLVRMGEGDGATILVEASYAGLRVYYERKRVIGDIIYIRMKLGELNLNLKFVLWMCDHS